MGPNLHVREFKVTTDQHGRDDAFQIYHILEMYEWGIMCIQDVIIIVKKITYKLFCSHFFIFKNIC